MAYRNLSAAFAYLLLTAAPGVPAFSDPAPGASNPPPVNLPAVRARIVTTRPVKSTEGLDYRIVISQPVGPPPPGGFPVIYVVDGNAWSGIAAEIARLDELEVGPTVVVGIGYPTDALLDNARRAYDLTPPGPAPAAAAGLKTGGADVFLRFIDETVKPAVGLACKVDPGRQILFGHSLGGLFVVHTLLTRPEAFTSYIAASPSIWWSDGIVLEPETAFEAHLDRHPKIRVLLTAGEYERDLDPVGEAKLRRLAASNPQLLKGKTVDAAIAGIREDMKKSRMIENASGLAERLAAHGLQARFVMFAGEDHNSEAVAALNRGIPFAVKPAD
jgi:predicted alpha/beta superfamily hydrolase